MQTHSSKTKWAARITSIVRSTQDDAWLRSDADVCPEQAVDLKVAAVQTWNGLPEDVTTSPTMYEFSVKDRKPTCSADRDNFF